MRITLLITTYERPDALGAVLRSVCRQTRPADQVIVADDGSGPKTKAVAESFADKLPLRHEWLAHDGFRAGRMRNLGLAHATGEYVVFIDDDILLHREFLADHEQAARPETFVQGSRALLSPALTQKAIAAETYWPGFFSRGVKKRKNLIRSWLLADFLGGVSDALKGIRTCNFAVWREDAVRINGFDEDFFGWGREDSEFAARLLNSGILRRNLRHAALTCHLDHPPRPRDRLAGNDALLEETIREKLIFRPHGLDKHMSSHNPVVDQPPALPELDCNGREPGNSN